MVFESVEWFKQGSTNVTDNRTRRGEGATENTRLENAAISKMQGLKLESARHRIFCAPSFRKF